jgi:hypothetical protein
MPSLPSQTLAPCICAGKWCSSRRERLRWYGTNCVIACCNRVNAARAVIVARACGWESSSVKIASAARLGGVSIQKDSTHATEEAVKALLKEMFKN